MMASFFKESDGFTLLELAIVLAILGVIAGFSLPLLSHLKQIDRKQATQKHQELVLTALGVYAARHHQLPCPADQQGLARRSCNDHTQTHAYGDVPYRTLGIPEATAKDAFGHHLHYAVNPALTEKDSYCTAEGVQQFLTLTDERNLSVIDEQEGMPLAVVILSEGEAYHKPMSSYEIENMAPTLRFHTRSYAQNPTQPFRHMVSWASREILITHYGHSSCPKAHLRPNENAQQPHDLEGNHDPLFQ